jgi:hypothetical protein
MISELCLFLEKKIINVIKKNNFFVKNYKKTIFYKKKEEIKNLYEKKIIRFKKILEDFYLGWEIKLL